MFEFKRPENKEQPQVKVPVKEEKKELTKADILKQYNYIESDIPLNSPYWKL